MDLEYTHVKQIVFSTFIKEFKIMNAKKTQFV